MINPAAEIKNIWRICAVGPDSTLEIRGLWPKGIAGSKPPKIMHYSAAYYPSVEDRKYAFEAAALAMNAEGYNVYIVMNPLRADFPCRGAAKDVDIRYRDLLLIDLDRVGDTSCPANDSELQAAKTLADRIRTFLAERGWPAPFIVMSGNGYHLYYVLKEFENDQQSDQLIRQLLNNLADNFDNSIVGVDTSVFNAARITKVPGTLMRKGLESADRPYRRSHVCDE